MTSEVRSASAPSLRPPFRWAEGGTGEGPTLHGHFATFNEWAEIDSVFEGRFLERIAPGAFARTLARDRSRLRVLFQHGKDPQVGSKVLGIPSMLREDERGAAYEVPLLDTGYVRELLPGLEAGAYGASMRFQVMREDWNETAEASSYNPNGLPERTIREAKVLEFGPVTFPAYEGATAGVRSLTDWYLAQPNVSVRIKGETVRERDLVHAIRKQLVKAGQRNGIEGLA
jgi:HK97 family phage prohead protease